MTPDVNVLVAAARADHVHHDVARAWMEEHVSRASAGAPFTLLPVVVAGFLRVVTDRRIFPVPMPTATAVGIVQRILDAPSVRLGVQGAEWPLLAELCSRHEIAGRDVSDAWIAASVLQQHEHLTTFDRGLRRWLPARRVTVLRG